MSKVTARLHKALKSMMKKKGIKFKIKAPSRRSMNSVWSKTKSKLKKYMK